LFRDAYKHGFSSWVKILRIAWLYRVCFFWRFDWVFYHMRFWGLEFKILRIGLGVFYRIIHFLKPLETQKKISLLGLGFIACCVLLGNLFQ